MNAMKEYCYNLKRDPKYDNGENKTLRRSFNGKRKDAS